MDPIFPPVYAIIWFGVYPATVLWGVVSTMFSPFAAGICMWLARRRGLNVRRYGLIGAIYSAFFLFPWINLVTRLLGRRMPRTIAIAGYVVLYVGWLASLLSVFSLALMDYRNPDGSLDIFRSLGFVEAFIGAVAAVWSALALVNNRKRWEEFPGDHTINSRELIYIAPFAFAFITVVIVIIKGFLVPLL